MILVSRIKKLQEDLCTLKEQCQELLAAKQVFSILFSLSFESKFGKEKEPNSEISYFVALEKMEEIVYGIIMGHYKACRLVSESKPFPFPFLYI